MGPGGAETDLRRLPVKPEIRLFDGITISSLGFDTEPADGAIERDAHGTASGQYRRRGVVGGHDQE
jgi:hypothetical protein